MSEDKPKPKRARYKGVPETPKPSPTTWLIQPAPYVSIQPTGGPTPEWLHSLFEDAKAKGIDETYITSGTILTSSGETPDWMKAITVTDGYLTRSIEALSGRITAIEGSLESVSGSAASMAGNIGQEMRQHLDQQIAPILADVASIKNDVLPQLQKTQSAVNFDENFIHNNVEFL